MHCGATQGTSSVVRDGDGYFSVAARRHHLQTIFERTSDRDADVSYSRATKPKASA